jgi:hypothetical protein
VAWNVFPVDAVASAPEYTGRELRQVLSALVDGATTARPLGGRSGVRKGTPTTTVVASGGNWSILPHIGILDLESAVEAGSYMYASDATTTPDAITAADATHPRKDIVYVTLDDPAESDGSSVPAVTPGYLAGTAAASPTAPATPARSMVLAEINVPNVAGGGATSATVTWKAPVTVAAGGIIPVKDEDERDAAGASATADNPIYTHRKDADAGSELEYTIDGATWYVLAAVGDGTLPHVRLYVASDQTRTLGTWGQVALSSATDIAGDQPWTYLAGAVTITEDGLYQIGTTITMTAAAFAVQIYRTGDSVALAQSPTGSGASFSNGTHCTRRLTAGDVIVVRVYPAATTNVEADEASKPSFVTFTRLSA